MPNVILTDIAQVVAQLEASFGSQCLRGSPVWLRVSPGQHGTQASKDLCKKLVEFPNVFEEEQKDALKWVLLVVSFSFRHVTPPLKMPLTFGQLRTQCHGLLLYMWQLFFEF